MINNPDTGAIKLNQAPGVVNYHFETFNLLAITDGDVEYDSSCFAPDIHQTKLKQIRETHHIVSPQFMLPHNILVIISADRIVMIDAGNGHKARPGAGKLVSNLHAAGIKPDDLTDIVLSHAHPDHFNGLMSDSGQLVFPNAKIHMHQKEFDFWQDDDADFSKSKNSRASLQSLQQEVKFFFSQISGKLQLFHTDEPLFDFLQPILTPGHTPGHCMFTITSGNEKFVHMADIFHDEIVLFAKPEWGTIFDIDFDLAVRTRQRILEKFALSKQRVFGYHLPWPGFGYIEKHNDVYTWMIE
ncbi:MBL fold metallo-hydrolase [Mucilaginibacter lappiensis]|uniref:Glyoxylase-like metal-dependent hydrolase (Beta-lactamase superfamily II) n=1 Tax=Mucilaginibacter lappiensis TaxID=354630 RepID=A0A841J971_9SPHI|nr:MBL fold metallo-hydrolase [Mucilaginibacter lappiensis]MBB6127264.1 glyoxylase-like metal-dependent hydrolase (beta-lactamase superfamily II) [Mucilaginibacter lappiensis]